MTVKLLNKLKQEGSNSYSELIAALKEVRLDKELGSVAYDLPIDDNKEFSRAQVCFKRPWHHRIKILMSVRFLSRANGGKPQWMWIGLEPRDGSLKGDIPKNPYKALQLRIVVCKLLLKGMKCLKRPIFVEKCYQDAKDAELAKPKKSTAESITTAE